MWLSAGNGDKHDRSRGACRTGPPMSDDPAGATRSPADPQYLGPPTIWDAQVEQMDEAECLRLISGGGVGRIAYSGQFGLAVLPVSYKLLEGSIVVRTPLGSTTDRDLRTGIR